ncbi:MAG: hypothetical protein KF729_25165 [Sandaracinaceae bacterium]|nr:hypothetical protein [Sandaracinaceae bacterium]
MTPAFLDGLLLAATVAGDRDGGLARAGLAPGPARGLAERSAALAALDAEARRDEVRRLAGSLRAIALDAALPVAARAILAPALDREAGRRWTEGASPVRRGFRAPPALRATLRRFATPADPSAHARELDAAEDADPRLAAWAPRLAEGADVARVTGALALGARGELRGDAASSRWRRIGAELASVWESPWRR